MLLLICVRKMLQLIGKGTRVNMILSFLTSFLQLNCNSTVSTELNAPDSQKKRDKSAPIDTMNLGVNAIAQEQHSGMICAGI
jgi:hypothetical protein